MERSIVFAGFGGQGILFAGHVLAEAAMDEGSQVIWIPSYGPEMRGGTAFCTVIIGDEPIGSPIVDHPDMAVTFNPPSLARFGPTIAPGGVLIVNDSLVEASAGRDDIDEVRVRCTQLAREAGDDRLINVVALGALVARTGIVQAESIREALRSVVGKKRPEALEIDLRAFDLGMAAVGRTAVPG